MKQTLLLLTLFSTPLLRAQSMTQANEPAIGENVTLYLCDSNAVNYSSLTGTGVTWDYSQLAGYLGQTKLVEVVDASTTPDYSSFPGSQKAYQVGNTIVTYFSSTSTERTSQGFMFFEPSLGDVVATFENDAMIQANYPFTIGNSLTDPYSGTIDFVFNSVPINEALTGDVYASVDGVGTLKFPLGVNVTDVLRYRSVDTSVTTLPIIGNVELIREQYEYYDYSQQNLPIFLHSTITMQQPSSGTPIEQVSLVLSYYPTAEYVGSKELTETKLTVFPNPAQDELIVQGSEGVVIVEVLDLTGSLITSGEYISGARIDVSDVQAGSYLVRLTSNGTVQVKKIVIK